MTPTEALFDEVLALTKSGHLRWHQISRSAHSDAMLHPERVCEQFEALWPRQEKTWTLLFVEKKHRERLHPLFGMSDVHEYELLVLEDGQRIRKLDKWTLSWGHLCSLAATIRHSGSVRETGVLSANS